jgi:2'-5' RNA ligase
MRAFVALPLAEPWLEAIREAQQALRWRPPSPPLAAEAAGAPASPASPASEVDVPTAKWVAPSGLHLTLAFLGELAEGLAAPLADRLAAVAGEVGCFTWRINGCGTFPSSRASRGSGGSPRGSARVLWCAVEGGEDLAHLAGKVRQACDEVAPGVRDPKPFHPHVTVARCVPPWPASAVARFEERFAALGVEPARAREAVFLRSDLRPGGAVHSALRHLLLREVPA